MHYNEYLVLRHLQRTVSNEPKKSHHLSPRKGKIIVTINHHVCYIRERSLVKHADNGATIAHSDTTTIRRRGYTSSLSINRREQSHVIQESFAASATRISCKKGKGAHRHRPITRVRRLSWVARRRVARDTAEARPIMISSAACKYRFDFLGFFGRTTAFLGVVKRMRFICIIRLRTRKAISAQDAARK